MRVKCWNCEKEFDEYLEINTSYEAYYGAPIGTFTLFTYPACPYCQSEEIEEIGEYVVNKTRKEP